MYFKVENLAFFKKRLFSPRRGSYAERKNDGGFERVALYFTIARLEKACLSDSLGILG